MSTLRLPLSVIDGICLALIPEHAVAQRFAYRIIRTVELRHSLVGWAGVCEDGLEVGRRALAFALFDQGVDKPAGALV